MPRARRRPATPIGDIGPETGAALAGCEIKTVQDPGKAPVQRKYRDHLLEQMAKPRPYPPGRFAPPLITQRQRDAGLKLHELWCETMRGPGPLKEYVQTSPDWAAIALSGVERIWDFASLSRDIPTHTRDVVLQVCLQGIPIQADRYEVQLGDLREGLSVVADQLRMNY